MGPRQDLIAVADAGPLIHLNEIGELSLLHVFASVHVPDAVWNATVDAGRVRANDLERVGAIQRHRIEPTILKQFVAESGPFPFHTGETECLFLCRQIPGALLLVDDLAAREAAWRQGVRPVGSLGIVVRACHTGRIPLAEAEDCIERLYRVSSLFVTKTIADLAVDQLRLQMP